MNSFLCSAWRGRGHDYPTLAYHLATVCSKAEHVSHPPLLGEMFLKDFLCMDERSGEIITCFLVSGGITGLLLSFAVLSECH